MLHLLEIYKKKYRLKTVDSGVYFEHYRDGELYKRGIIKITLSDLIDTIETLEPNAEIEIIKEGRA